MAEEQNNIELEIRKLEFEKYKYRIEIFKWIIGSVALVLVTTIIDWGFRDRTAGLAEIEKYDKYVSQLIVLNTDPVSKRMLAQFFSKVTPSDKLREGWQLYYEEVDKEYRAYVAPIEKIDSAARVKLFQLSNQDSITNDEKQDLEKLKIQVEENKRILHPQIILPEALPQDSRTTALDWERKGFEYLLNKDVDNAITAFRNSENAFNSFHQVYEIAQYLNKQKEKLRDPSSELWRSTYAAIVKDFSWQMPGDVRAKLEALK